MIIPKQLNFSEFLQEAGQYFGASRLMVANGPELMQGLARALTENKGQALAQVIQTVVNSALTSLLDQAKLTAQQWMTKPDASLVEKTSHVLQREVRTMADFKPIGPATPAADPGHEDFKPN